MKTTTTIQISLALLLQIGRAPAADPLDQWHIRNPVVPFGHYGGVAFGNEQLMMFTADALLTSDNGRNWTALTSYPDYWGGAVSVSYANGRFFVGYGWGKVASTSDGIAWTYLSWVGNQNVTEICYGNGRYIATTELDYASANISTSTTGDLYTWSQMRAGAANSLYGVAFGNGTFVVVGLGGNIASSSTGTSWTTRNSGTAQHLWSIAFGNGVFVAVGDAGQLLTSTDGATWTLRNAGTSLSLARIRYGNGRFVAVGAGGTILTSSDGVNWSSRSSGVAAGLTGVTLGTGEFVAVGSNGTILTSPEAATWTALEGSVTSALLTSVTYGPGGFVVVGFNGTVLTSPDGAAWTARSSGTSLGLYSVTHGNGTFVAVGQIIVSSPDGVHWTPQFTGAGLDFETVAYLNGAFLAIGAGGVMRVSTDGITWSSRTSGTSATLYGIAYGNGLYVVGGAGGTIRTSPDGITWTARSSGTSYDLNGVAFANGQFVAQGNYGVMRTSLDGMNWTPRTSGTGQGLATSTYDHGNLVVVGMAGTILSSANGINWTSRNSGTSQLLLGITSGNGTFVVVGDAGTILQSDPFVSLEITGQPMSQGVTEGTEVTFSVSVAGIQPFFYQWNFNGEAISGATNATLILPQVGHDQIGAYCVSVSNSFGVSVSSNAVLEIVYPPTIVGYTPDLTIVAGENATFTVTVTNTASLPVGYQLRKGSTIITNAVLAARTCTFTLGRVSLTATPTNGPGNYRLVVTNAANYQPGLATPLILLTVIPATAPMATTLGAGPVTATGAALNAEVNPHGATTTVWFDYGLTSAYGSSSTVTNIGTATEAVAVRLPIAGLSPLTEYHYRVVAANSGGTSLGADLTFQTTEPAEPLVISRCVMLEEGHAQLQFTGQPGLTYSVLMSTNLTDWERIGTASEVAPGAFEFTDTGAPGQSGRFYRLRSP